MYCNLSSACSKLSDQANRRRGESGGVRGAKSTALDQSAPLVNSPANLAIKRTVGPLPQSTASDAESRQGDKAEAKDL